MNPGSLRSDLPTAPRGFLKDTHVCRADGYQPSPRPHPAHITDGETKVQSKDMGVHSHTGAGGEPGFSSHSFFMSLENGTHKGTSRRPPGPPTSVPGTLLLRTAHSLCLWQSPPPLGLLCTLSSVGKASVWALSHTWQTCHPIVTPALAHPSQALTPFSMRTKSSAHAYHQGLGTDKSQGPGSTRLAGVRQLVLIRQMIYLPHSITANSIYMIYLFRDGKAIHTWILRAYCSAWPQTGA